MSEPFVVAFVAGVTPGKWARAWQLRMPGTELTLLPLAQPAALAALANGTADVALVRLPVADPEFSTIALYDEQPVVVASKGHAIEAVDSVTLLELVEFAILPGEGDEGWAAAVELAAANTGVAVMPQSVARAHSRKDVIARPIVDAPQTHVALVWPTERTTAAVDEFIGIVRGRTANSSRGARPQPEEKAPVAPARPARPARPATPGRKSGGRITKPKPKPRGRNR